MENKYFIKGFLCCAVLLARLLFLGVLVLVPAGSGFAENACEYDVACSPEGDPWRPPAPGPPPGVEIPAVGFITFAGDTTPCTGTLLNNGDSTHPRQYYFLTAYHCLQGQDPMTISPADTAIRWQLEADPASTACGSGTHVMPAIIPTEQTGITYVAGWGCPVNTPTCGASDFLLLQLSATAAPPPAADGLRHYAGWDARVAAPTTNTVSIHQPMSPPASPSGVKAISLSTTAPVPDSFQSVPTSPPSSRYWKVLWHEGTTEDGSSGSCLFDEHHRCIGQLYGGPPGGGVCPVGGSGGGPSWYGKFSESWTGDGTTAHSLSSYLTSPYTTYDDGDPHINYADGKHYNFQGAGEYVALRNSDLEIQTRQTPLASTFNPGGLPDDGIATCVSLNTAVAARVGIHKVRYEPNFRGEPGLKIHVDHEDPITLDQLGQEGRNLDGGHIAKIVDPTYGFESLEIDFPNHIRMIATPGGLGEGKYYLNLQVDRLPVMDATKGVAPADVGLMGPIPKGSWLPAPQNGPPVPMPPSYTGLYQTFGESWRVTDKTSLFDYASGTSTETFTLPSCASTDFEKGSEKPCWPPKIPPNWPPEKPRCLISGTTPPEPASEPVAQEACHQITGKNMLADCIFDVRVTGNTGFAQTYLTQQQSQLGATKTTVEGDKDVTKYGRIVTFTATVGSAASRIQAVPTGSVQFSFLHRGTVYSPAGSLVMLDPNGHATWPTKDLLAGLNQVAASYIPSTGTLYLASVSPYENVVIETFNWYFWLAIVLPIIVLIFLVWWYLRTI